MAQKPSIPKGTRDFGPVEMAKRNYIFNTIKEVYALYGFQQIETPAMETLQTLMGKYGEEGDKLLFKVLNSGDYICIVGENGSGKSTLMKTILGLQPIISGKVFTGDGLKFNEIGYMPQQTAIQKDFPASVREIVISGC